MSAREAALQTLVAMDHQKAWSNGHLKKVIQEAHLDRRDAALATRLCFGVLQNRMLLDHYLQQYSTMKLTKMESKVRNSLRLGLYQMLFLTKIPVSAAVSESVALAKKLCKNPRAGGMVNGILRNLARHLDDLPTLDRSHPTAYLSLLYSHPQWLVEDWGNRLDGEELEALLRWDNSEPPVTVQVNTCRFQTPEVVELLQREGMAVTPHPWLADCLTLTATGDLTQSEGWRQGMFYPQDPAARLAVLAAGLTPGCKVLDACAAPGGKSFAAAMVMGDRGEIHACDLHPHKKALIQAGADRLGLQSITPQVADGKKPRKGWGEAFDVVLADVPCSGLGVLRKKTGDPVQGPRSLGRPAPDPGGDPGQRVHLCPSGGRAAVFHLHPPHPGERGGGPGLPGQPPGLPLGGLPPARPPGLGGGGAVHPLAPAAGDRRLLPGQTPKGGCPCLISSP